jgi:uncharacterized membrane protein
VDPEQPGTSPSSGRARGFAVTVRDGLLRWLGRCRVAGPIGALVLFAAALGPSLTPRPPSFQGAAAGLCAAAGYAIGAFVGWLLRRLGVPAVIPERWQRRGWWAFGAVALVVVIAALAVSATWQRQVRDLMGMPQPGSEHPLLVLGVAALVLVLLVGLGRGLRAAVRALTRPIARVLPPLAARLLSATAVAVLLVLLVDGVLGGAVRGALSAAYETLDDDTYAWTSAPTAAERSGSPASAQAWDTLGREGRRFVATGPTADDLAAFDATIGVERPVKEPIRVYAGRTSGHDLDAVAANVVAELDRTDAWDRSVLVVATTTGTGWIDPPAAAALELEWGGDTAIAAMQYSYLPSWVSFVGDRETPQQAGRALFEAVRARWLEQPADHRPLLLVFGISLGSYGSQGAFTSLADATERTDGAVWTGTPSFTPLWGQLTADRDAGSRQIDPVYDEGRSVRWGVALEHDQGAPLDPGDASWATPRVVYLQHASDGVTWWSTDLLLHRPDWSREPRGADVLDSVHWVPVASFVQVGIDLFVAGDVPSGHGHNFAVEYADAWASVAPPEGWTDDDTAALRTTIADAMSGTVWGAEAG